METHLWQQGCRARTIGLCAMIWMSRQNGQGTINLLGQHRAHKQMWPGLRAECESAAVRSCENPATDHPVHLSQIRHRQCRGRAIAKTLLRIHDLSVNVHVHRERSVGRLRGRRRVSLSASSRHLSGALLRREFSTIARSKAVKPRRGPRRAARFQYCSNSCASGSSRARPIAASVTRTVVC